MNGFSRSENNVSFRINGKKFTVAAGVSENTFPNSVLVDFIRKEAGLTGTKYMCREGGCGACVVAVNFKDSLGQITTAAVNSCLIPVFSCDGWDISTIEKLGNHKDGYDIIQNRMVGFSGTQCGFCTPGMVMNMYGLIKSKPNLTAKEIEDSFDGNLCRCTGFRPIMDAMKSLAIDVPESIKRKCAEIEESSGKICHLKESCCKAGKCLKSSNHNDCPSIEDYGNDKTMHPVNLKLVTGQRWVKPTSLNEALNILRDFGSQGIKYRIVAGNTSTGVYKNQGSFSAYIDVNGLSELTKYNTGDKTVTFGGGTKLAVAIKLLKKISKLSGFEYGVELAKHWQRVANTPVRNIATIAGNLMIKHAHNEFPSDIFLTLEGVGARINIVSKSGTPKSYSMLEFLQLDMTGNLILDVELPSLPKKDGYVVRTFKITKRFQNAHAYVNAALVFKLGPTFVVSQTRICFGGIKPSFVHASLTEDFLTGKSVRDVKVVQQALEILENELVADFRPPEASPQYRKLLARNLLYKTILGILGEVVPSKYNSGGTNLLHDELTSGKQTYDTHKEQWPLTKPIPKLEAAVQSSGEAEYVNDIPSLPNELFGAFVISKVANADLKSIDATEALKMPGVVAFVSAKDIPGANNYICVMPFPVPTDQDIFINKKVRAAGQPLGLVLAESKQAAYDAVKLVKVYYENVTKPILAIKDAVELAQRDGTFAKSFFPPTKSKVEPPNTKHQIRGEFVLNGQAHFPMEAQIALCIPKEGGMDVYSATQYMDQVQACIAGMLKVPNNSINVQVRRLGGAFGVKASPATHVAAACALAAYVTNRPVRVVLDLETSMSMIGKRCPYWCNYEAGFDDDGKIQSLNVKLIADTGAFSNEPEIIIGMALLQNAYDGSGWQILGGSMKTDTAPNTYCRAPGSTQGLASIETIMEHISHYLKKDPLEVRMNNLIKDGGEVLGVAGIFPPETFHGENVIEKLVEDMKTNANYVERRNIIVQFNKANRWIKRGLSIVPMRYPQHIFAVAFPSYVAIYHEDGSVVISHGGIEMGQGINTKAAQVVGYALNISLEKIKVKPTNNLLSANGNMTAGAISSELISWSVYQACKILLERMAPVKAKLGNDVPWEKLVAASHGEGIDLKAGYLPTRGDDLKPYDIWGLNLTEVEVDILTGEFKVLRVDLIEDAGKSMSPEVDVGQVEGSLIMGMGLWTLEKLQYDKESGELLTNNTWEYKPPFAKDIPKDLRVTLLCNTTNPVGIHGSKATGEPPLCMSIAVVFALKHAINSAREDAGNVDHYHIETPLTPENILEYCLTSKKDLQI